MIGNAHSPHDSAPATLAERNIDLVMEGLEAFLSGNVGRALELAHPDVTTFRAPPLPDAQTYEGRRGIVEAYLDWTTDFEDFQVSPQEVLGTGDVVVVEARQRGRGRSSGAPVEGRFWSVYTVEGGKVSRWEIFSSRREALESAGIAPVSDESRTSRPSTGMNPAPIARKELVR
jgi:ketosteroid isomerase-like protein